MNIQHYQHACVCVYVKMLWKVGEMCLYSQSGCYKSIPVFMCVCVCVCVCVCGQRVSAAATGAGVRRAEGSDHGAVLLHDALRRLLHDVPPDQRAVRHQTLHHLQHAGGTALWAILFYFIYFYFVICLIFIIF